MVINVWPDGELWHQNHKCQVGWYRSNNNNYGSAKFVKSGFSWEGLIYSQANTAKLVITVQKNNISNL